LLYIADYSLFVHLFRNFVGGFGNGGRIATCVGEYLGFPFGVLGVAGTWCGRRDWVKSYQAFLWFRLGCFAVMYYFDVKLILDCESWVNNLHPTTEAYGWNELMYEIAMHGGCSSTRSSFFIWSTLTVFMTMYMISITDRYLDYTGRLPKHLLRMPKDLTSGAFYSHSLGERSVLNNMWGKFAHHRVEEFPVGDEPTEV